MRAHRPAVAGAECTAFEERREGQRVECATGLAIAPTATLWDTVPMPPRSAPPTWRLLELLPPAARPCHACG